MLIQVCKYGKGNTSREITVLKSLKCFIKSLKMSWVRRIFGEDCQWLTLFNETYGSTGNVFFENTWCDSLLKRLPIPFGLR